MEKRFTVLRLVSTIFKILAWIVLVFGVLGACGLIALFAMGAANGAGGDVYRALGFGAGGALGGVAASIGVLVAALFYFLILYAWGDILTLLVSLEENTRLTAERLMHLVPPVSNVLPPLPPLPAVTTPPPAEPPAVSQVPPAP